MIFLSAFDTKDDQSLFEELYRKYSGKMHSYAVSRLKDEGYAEEVVQDTFFRIANHIKKLSFMDEKSRKYYCYSILRHTVISKYHREKERQNQIYLEEKDVFVSAEDIEKKVIDSEEIKQVMKQISELPELDRNILYFAMKTSLTSKQIGELFGITAGNVRIRLARTRAKLREQMRKENAK